MYNHHMSFTKHQTVLLSQVEVIPYGRVLLKAIQITVGAMLSLMGKMSEIAKCYREALNLAATHSPVVWPERWGKRLLIHYYCTISINLTVRYHSNLCQVEIWAVSWVTECHVKNISLKICPKKGLLHKEFPHCVKNYWIVTGHGNLCQSSKWSQRCAKLIKMVQQNWKD
jgi:uncharacterized membrane protein